MAEKQDFAARLLRLEQEISTYTKVHQEELDQLQTTLETLKHEFLTQEHQDWGVEQNGLGNGTKKR